MNAAVGRQPSLWMTVYRLWNRIPAAVDFIFSTYFSFKIKFEWTLATFDLNLTVRSELYVSFCDGRVLLRPWQQLLAGHKDETRKCFVY